MVPEIDDAWLGRRPVIPQETCVLVACDSADEANYVCAVLNSAIVGELVSSHSVRGGKGFGTPSMLDFIPLQRFQGDDPRHAELAALGREAHACPLVVSEIQQQIDRLTAELLGVHRGTIWLLSAGNRSRSSRGLVHFSARRHILPKNAKAKTWTCPLPAAPGGQSPVNGYRCALQQTARISSTPPTYGPSWSSRLQTQGLSCCCGRADSQHQSIQVSHQGCRPTPVLHRVQQGIGIPEMGVPSTLMAAGFTTSHAPTTIARSVC